MTIDEVNEKISNLISESGLSGYDIAELGVGLLARGIFRIGDSELENNPNEAFDVGLNATSIIRDLSFSFKKIAQDIG